MVVHIVATGYNCAGNVKKFVDSVLRQTNDNWVLHIVDDGSNDNTPDAVRKHSFSIDAKNNYQFDVRLCTENLGAACRRWEVIKDLPPDSIVALAGLDDELLPNCVEKIIEQHQEGKWMTYGNWIDQKRKGLPRSFNLEFPESVHTNRNYRKETYRSTAINTFRAFLFQAIPVDDFKIDGKWIDSTTESEVMFSCLEMCGKDRIGIIYEPIYLYNRNLPNGTLKRLGTEYKYKLLDIIKSRPAKPLYEDLMSKEKQPAKEFSLPTKTSKEAFESATKKLIERRATGVTDKARCETLVANYHRHLRSFELGKSLLDVGCGTQSLKKALHDQFPDVKYTGIDAFTKMDGVINVAIEKINVKKFEEEHGEHDTICCFAALDSMQDLVKACDNMKKLAKKNIVFLTGIDIEPDEFHTFKITRDLLNELMSGWKIGKLNNALTDKVLLIEYVPE